MSGNYEMERVLAENPDLLREAEELKELPPDPAEVGAELLKDIIEFIRKYVLITDAQAVVTGLWVLHAHCFHVFEFSPYCLVTSPEKRCGKSRLMEVMQLLVPRAWGTSHATSAVLVRKINRMKPTLFMDELDALLNGPKEYVESVRGILDEGDRRNGNPVSLCVRKGNQWVDADFRVYCPKVLAGIGSTLETWADRGFQLRLERKPKGSNVERFRYRKAAPKGKALRERAQRWCAEKQKVFAYATAEMPDELDDRQQDHLEPLLIMANALAGEWPKTARESLVAVCKSVDAEDVSIGVRLLADIAQIFVKANTPKLFSAMLATRLVAIETSPWSEFGKQHKPITQNALAKLLYKFKDQNGQRIQPRMVDIAGEKLLGYRRKDFLDAWKRYVPAIPASLLKDAEEDKSDEEERQETKEPPQTDLFDP
jgi:hypothetical protein